MLCCVFATYRLWSMQRKFIQYYLYCWGDDGLVTCDLLWGGVCDGRHLPKKLILCQSPQSRLLVNRQMVNITFFYVYSSVPHCVFPLFLSLRSKDMLSKLQSWQCLAAKPCLASSCKLFVSVSTLMTNR